MKQRSFSGQLLQNPNSPKFTVQNLKVSFHQRERGRCLVRESWDSQRIWRRRRTWKTEKERSSPSLSSASSEPPRLKLPHQSLSHIYTYNIHIYIQSEIETERDVTDLDLNPNSSFLHVMSRCIFICALRNDTWPLYFLAPSLLGNYQIYVFNFFEILRISVSLLKYEKHLLIFESLL